MPETPLFDTHCHLQSERFAADREEVLARAGDMRLLVPGCDLASSRAAVALAERHPNVYAAVGVHPSDCAGWAGPGGLRELLAGAAPAAREKIRAIGETGLDFHWPEPGREAQERVFRDHLALAEEFSLPVVLHARDSAAAVLDLVEPFVRRGGRAVWHCYSGPKKELPALTARAVEMGLWLGVGGMITYEEQGRLREELLKVPDKHLLLDSDSPYLVPRPRASERNEPALCKQTAEALARLRGVSLADVARITTRNACDFLGLPAPMAAAEIAYPIRDSLYLNLTSRCNNACTFCARNRSYVVKGHDLRLAAEPTVAEVMAAMGDFSQYREVVFCGFGEPTLRLPELKEIAARVHAAGKPVRLNTNGLANLQYGRDVAPELAGLVDTVSISLNSADPAQYQRLCRSTFGERAHPGLLEFARACLRQGIRTVLTVVAMPDIDVAAAERLARETGAEFRARSFVDAG